MMSPAFETADGRTFESWKREPRVVGRRGSQVVLKGKALAACATTSGMRPWNRFRGLLRWLELQPV
jgi:hypothetical protein